MNLRPSVALLAEGHSFMMDAIVFLILVIALVIWLVVLL